MNHRQRQKFKKGKVCAVCKSAFELTIHHVLPKHNSKYEYCMIVLCRTCHEQIDFRKNLKCYTKAKLKLYHKRNEKMENELG